MEHRALWLRLRTWLLVVGLGLGMIIFGPVGGVAKATASPIQSPAETVTIHLSTAADELRFEPETLEFTAGQRYTLVLDNPSHQKHYFTAKDFADAIWSQKVDAGNVEVKGAIHELEIKPGAVAKWTFIPLKPGRYELHCSIAGHAEAGMVGHIAIQDPA